MEYTLLWIWSLKSKMKILFSGYDLINVSTGSSSRAMNNKQTELQV